MKKITFVCKTPLQLVSFLCILDNYLKEENQCEVACFIASDRFQQKQIQQIRELGVFKFVHQIVEPNLIRKINYKLDTSSFSTRKKINYLLFSIISRPKPIRDFVISNLYFKFLAEPYVVDFLKASNEIFIHDAFGLSQTILKQISKNCQLHQFDEGVGTYTSKFYKSLQPHFVHLFEPKLDQLENINSTIKSIPKISKNNSRLMNWLSTLYPNLEENTSNDAIYLDQNFPLDSWEFQQKIKVINVLSQKFPNLTVRLHPAETQNTIDKLTSLIDTTVVSIKKSEVPFEIELLLGKIKPKILISAFSSASTHWRLMLSNEEQIKVKSIFLDPIFQDSKKLNTTPEGCQQREVRAFFELYSKIFPNNTITINNINELKELNL